MKLGRETPRFDNSGYIITPSAREGGSAGGLLAGAVLNMRPDLFKAALRRPFPSSIRLHAA